MKGEILRKISLDTIGVIPELNIVVSQEENADKSEEDDYLVKTIGAFGLWQGIISTAVALTRAIALWNMMSIGFLTPVTEYKCVKFADNLTVEVKNSTCYSTCLKYNYSSIVRKNIIEDFDLICQDAWLASFTQSILMLGLLLGVSIFGWISDRFGRRMALLLSTFMNAVFMVALPFSPNYVMFCSIRFCVGIATGGSLIVCVVQVMEIIGKEHREIAGACTLLPDGLAEASLAVFAYYTSDWQGYTMSYAIATCIIFVVLIYIPESPRWLVTNGRLNEAIGVITKAAKRNKLDSSNIEVIITKAVEDMKLKDNNYIKTTYMDFFRSKKSALLTLTVFVIWFACGVCFYGVYQYLTLISSNPYLTTIIAGLVQVPMCPVGIFLNKSFGRKFSTVGTTVLAGATMIVLIFIPQGHWSAILLGVIGFSSLSVSFGIAYIYVSELFPTPLRNMALGMSSGGAKVGAMLSPFLANLTPRWLPSLVFGIIPFIAAVSCLTLPETKGRNLKDSIKK